jgi:hypothetical protein
MSSVFSEIASTARAASILGLLALVSHSAVAASKGSTDIYLNEFRTSFDAGPTSSAPLRLAGEYNGSTDIWGNGFRVSFGRGSSATRPADVCGNGSTDVWGNGFRASFSPAASPIASGLVQACEGSASVLR